LDHNLTEFEPRSFLKAKAPDVGGVCGVRESQFETHSRDEE